MSTDRKPFDGKHNGICDLVLKAYYDVYNELGSGFLESVYHAALHIALTDSGLRVSGQVLLPVYYRGQIVGKFAADLIVNDSVLLELKAVQAFDRTHFAQVLHYLKSTPIEVALLLNFGPRPEFKRFVLDNDQKKIRVTPCESVVDSGRA